MRTLFDKASAISRANRANRANIGQLGAHMSRHPELIESGVFAGDLNVHGSHRAIMAG